MTMKITTTHKGYSITTRCLAIEHSRFQASFTVAPPFGVAGSWQEFATSHFCTAEAATKDALHAAMRLIEADDREAHGHAN